MSNRQRRLKRGFTLIELLLALSIIVVLTLIGIPAIKPMIQSSGVRGGLHTLQGALRHARYAAIAEQKSASCWIAPGSVTDSGTVATSQMQAVEFIIDNADTTPGANYFSTTGTWNGPVSYAGCYPTTGGSFLHVPCTSTPTHTAIWTFEAPGIAGSNINLSVAAWWRESASGATDAKFTVNHALGPNTYNVNMTGSGAQWNTLGGSGNVFTFKCGESYTIVLDNSSAGTQNVYADAVRITGEAVVPPDDPTTQFVAVGKTWTTNQWTPSAGKSCYVTVAHPVSAEHIVPITAAISSNDETTLTAASPWQTASGTPVTLVDGSQFLITAGNPLEGDALRKSVGSGTSTTFRWTQLPDGIVVSPYRIDDDGKESTTPVFPIVFKSTGRAAFSPAYITLKVYVKNDDGTIDESAGRFLRVFRNTGRVFSGLTIADLPS
jgi:prepilin-type N-terminal cleavage/methylation domain-containing protein